MKLSAFNVPGSDAGRFCLKHEEGTLNANNTKCAQLAALSAFNVPGSNAGRFC